MRNAEKLAAAINQHNYSIIKMLLMTNDVLFTMNLNQIYWEVKTKIYYTKCEYESIMREVFK